MKDLIKCVIVALGVTFYFSVQAWRIRHRSMKPSPLSRYLMERENRKWINQHNKRRAA